MTPEPQRLFTPTEQAKLDALVARYIAEGTEIVPLTPLRGGEAFRDIALRAEIRQGIAEATDRLLFSVTHLPLDDTSRVRREVRKAKDRRSRQQVHQWNVWKLGGGDLVFHTIGVAVTWNIPPHWEPEVSEAWFERHTAAMVMPILADALGVPLYCFDEPWVMVIAEANPLHQGISITLGRED